MEDELDVLAAFGGQAQGERFAVYIPNKDRDGFSVEQKAWIDEAILLFSKVGGGATAMPPVSGAWLNTESGKLVFEEPVLVYSYVDPDSFGSDLPKLVEFVKRLGRSTNQGSVGVEFGGTFFFVNDFN